MVNYATHLELSDSPDFPADRLDRWNRLLIWGEMGIGKSTLSLNLLPTLHSHHGSCQLLELDPGSPPIGVPGAICRIRWHDEALRYSDCHALCSLNAARFRLPLIQAAVRLAGIVHKDQETTDKETGPLIIDPPGVTRGVGGAELLVALAESLRIDCILALHRPESDPPLLTEMLSLGTDMVSVAAHPAAAKPANLIRSKHRTELWNRFLKGCHEMSLPLEDLALLGTPPPVEMPEIWIDRQIAVLDKDGTTLAIGEVIRLEKGRLTIRANGDSLLEHGASALLIRDAGRDPRGRLSTIAPTVAPRHNSTGNSREPVEMRAPVTRSENTSPPVSSYSGPAWATLVGGVFGDPLLHVRLRHRKTGFLFDLGDPARLAAKMAHQVRYVFLSHCHIDHVGGFLWFLRSRMGPFPPCRIFGPVHTIDRLDSFIRAITWDRIDDCGPVFEVGEIDGAVLKRARLQPGKACVSLPDHEIKEGIVVAEEEYLVKTAVVDHQIPSIAYALIFHNEIKVKKDSLAASGLEPGPWLGRLKKTIVAGYKKIDIDLPDGSSRKAGDLENDLLIIRPGKKLVYATDLADTPENRKKLVELAKGAHTFFCETPFTAEDADKARTTQHLTTRAAVEIALAAGAERLVPTHFSKRYERSPETIYDELRDMAGPLRIIGHPSDSARRT